MTCAAVTALALAVAVAAGAVAVPDLAGELSDATRSLGGWIYLAVMALVFLETTALLGFMIHGELALMLGGVAAERGDASLLAMIALVCAAAVAGDMVSLLLGRRLGRPFLERHGGRIGLGPARLARVDGFFARHGGKALFLGRFTGFLRATMPFVAGSSGLTARRLLPYSAPARSCGPPPSRCSATRSPSPSWAPARRPRASGWWASCSPPRRSSSVRGGRP